MVKIRLTRLGKHKAPFYRIVAVDSRSKRDGEYIELLGTYEPFKSKYNLKRDLIIKYLSNGAQPTDTILNIFKKEGIWKEFVSTKSTKKKTKKSKKTRKTKSVEKTKKVEEKAEK